MRTLRVARELGELRPLEVLRLPGDVPEADGLLGRAEESAVAGEGEGVHAVGVLAEKDASGA